MKFGIFRPGKKLVSASNKNSATFREGSSDHLQSFDVRFLEKVLHKILSKLVLEIRQKKREFAFNFGHSCIYGQKF